MPEATLRQQQIVEEFFLSMLQSVGASRNEALLCLEEFRKKCAQVENKSLTDSFVDEFRKDLENFRAR